VEIVASTDDLHGVKLQDVQLNTVRAELSDLLSKNSETQRRLDESVQQIQQLKDQNALLKAQKGALCYFTPPPTMGTKYCDERVCVSVSLTV